MHLENCSVFVPEQHRDEQTMAQRSVGVCPKLSSGWGQDPHSKPRPPSMVTAAFRCKGCSYLRPPYLGTTQRSSWKSMEAIFILSLEGETGCQAAQPFLSGAQVPGPTWADSGSRSPACGAGRVDTLSHSGVNVRRLIYLGTQHTFSNITFSIMKVEILILS